MSRVWRGGLCNENQLEEVVIKTSCGDNMLLGEEGNNYQRRKTKHRAYTYETYSHIGRRCRVVLSRFAMLGVHNKWPYELGAYMELKKEWSK